MSTTVLDPVTFTAEDRCDRCGAQAKLRAVMPAGELLFCGHHARQYADKLRETAVRIDEAADAA